MTNNFSFKITLLITLSCATLSCSIENQNLVENNFVQVSATPTPLKFFKDENGNYIKEDGWEIPKFEVKKKKQLTVQISTNKEGKAIKIYSYNIALKNQVLIKEPFASDNTFAN